MKAKGYRVTNTVNNMCYYGIIYKEGKTVEDRLQEHMSGKGGVILFSEGVEKYGLEAFIVEEIIEGELDDIREWEKNINTTNLWPKGYNGNAGPVIVKSDLTEAKRHAGYQKYLNNRSQEHVDAANKKRKITRAGRSRKEINTTADKLSKASKKHWESLDDKAKAEFLKNRGKAKSEAYQKQSEEYKQAIRDKIKKSMCKKQYKSPTGIHDSTVDGGRVEGISPALFNHRCKSEYYSDYSILSS
tara:strand:+ start:146 stop:877 length:732 start_codon:yes stop_codon:yes gene_type:complete